MKKMFLLFLLSVLLTSCYEIKRIPTKSYAGNRFNSLIGKNKNVILRSMPSHPLITSDGNGGEILIYEDVTTISNSQSSISSSSTAYNRNQAGYDYRGIPTIQGKGYSTTDVDSNNQTVVYKDKQYANFFINTKGICYDVKTNYGDIYNTEYHCYKAPKRVSDAIYLTFIIPPLGLICTLGALIQNAKANRWQPSVKSSVPCY